MPKGYKRRPFSWVWVVRYKCVGRLQLSTASKHRYKSDATNEAGRLMKHPHVDHAIVTRRMVREGW